MYKWQKYQNERGEWCPKFQLYWDAVASTGLNFDCNLIAHALDEGWTITETVAQAQQEATENLEYARALRADFEFLLDRDMSMNA